MLENVQFPPCVKKPLLGTCEGKLSAREPEVRPAGDRAPRSLVTRRTLRCVFFASSYFHVCHLIDSQLLKKPSQKDVAQLHMTFWLAGVGRGCRCPMWMVSGVKEKLEGLSLSPGSGPLTLNLGNNKTVTFLGTHFTRKL